MDGKKNTEYVMHLHYERCKECGYCIKSCPVGALSVSSTVNLKGYTVVQIDKDACTTCAICHTVCPDYVFERVKGA